MPITVRIPTPLRQFTDGKDAVEVSAANVRELLDALDSSHTGLKARLCEDDGEVRRFVNLYVNEEDIRFLENLDTSLKDGDEVSVVPAIAGGCGAGGAA
ncbi:MAG: ubiquitin-like small modifier protein 1 [Planctomycetota bacterium]|jgi:molybdopterin synthase sulfur carrier subunit